MAVTLKDIAKHCGLGTTTVSNILNQHHPDLYPEDTRRRVLEAAETYDYRPNRMAQAIRAQRTRVVSFAASSVCQGFLHNFQTNPFVVGMSNYLIKYHYHVGLTELNEMEPDKNCRGESVQLMLPGLRERFFDGMVIGHGLSKLALDAVASIDLPAVLWDADYLKDTNCISRDEYEVGRRLTQALLEVGHRRIAFMWSQDKWEAYVGSKGDHFSTAHRYHGYCDAMKVAGLTIASITSYSPAVVASQMIEISPTALITLGDNENFSLLLALSQLGYQVPKDVSIASCDIEARIERTIPWSGGMTYDRYSAGEAAASMLLELLDDPGKSIQSRKVIGEFRMGDTIMPPNI